MKKNLGGVFHELARQKDSRIEEGHLMPDHVHMLISIPPKHKVSEVVGFIKGKSAIWIARRPLPPLGGATFRWLYNNRFERANQATGFAGGS